MKMVFSYDYILKDAVFISDIRKMGKGERRESDPLLTESAVSYKR